MLVDHRTYHVHPGTLHLQLGIYEKFGFEVQKRYLGEPLAFLVTETGDLNTYVHLWAYEDATDRERRRKALNEDPSWLVYVEKAFAAGYIIKQVTKLMTPAPFSPITR
ncbi:MAG: hypothetical protein JWO66_1835 [Candidatus Eremiobacteraeota bacterium]|jgi:hypothetical protein|nr:hypothetical protein [Candidatus Eremiobacteraeota bacterium]